ncbi:MAG: CNNM domain-containing protein [Planctomycetota bacterium]
MALLLTYLFLSIGFSFYCSVAEAVLLSVSPSFIATLKRTRPGAAERLEKLKSNIDRPLAAILSLNTIAHTIGAAGVGAQSANLFEPGDDSFLSKNAVGIASAVMTLLILVFSEIIPKTIGALYWRGLSPSVSKSVSWLILLLYPLVWMSEQLTRLLAGGEKGHQITRDELSAMAVLGQKEGVLAAHEVRIYQSLLKLTDLSTKDIMTPRVVVIGLKETTTVAEFVASIEQFPVSRVPVYRAKLDDADSFVLKTDVLLAHAQGDSDTPIEQFKRKLPTVRDEEALPTLFNRLLSERQQIAMVVDQFGTAAGIVTLEDLVETLLDVEIVDESDHQIDMQSFARERWQKRIDRAGIPRPASDT